MFIIKIFKFIPKTLNLGKFVLLVFDTMQYFYNEAVKRGIYQDDKVEIPVKKISNESPE